MDKNLYDLPAEEAQEIPTVASSLEEVLHALDVDREFLKRDEVFTDETIEAYINLLKDDAQRIRMAPHPLEFKMHYSV